MLVLNTQKSELLQAQLDGKEELALLISMK